MKSLFSAFEPVSESQWLERITVDLKGKSIDLLASRPEADLDIVAYHHRDKHIAKKTQPVLRNLDNSSNDWAIRQVFNNTTDSNQDLLDALNDGVNALGIVLSDSGTKLEELTKEVGFEYIQSDLIFKTKELALATTINPATDLNFDVLAINATAGTLQYNLDDYHAFYAQHNQNKTVWVSGELYGIAGASSIQELGFTLLHLNEYIQSLVDRGESLDTIHSKICISLSVNDNYFVNLAKFRAIHGLVALIFRGYDPEYDMQPVKVYAQTNIRHLAQRDMNNNPLRQTTQAMSAILGGCDVLTVTHAEYGSEQDVERFRRIAKNIQLILKEEAYFDKVQDPAGGSYYVEALTEQIMEKAWNQFLKLEDEGGYLACLKAGRIQEIINENKAHLIADMNNEKRTFLGVNKFPNSLDGDLKLNFETNSITKTSFPALTPFLLEEAFVPKTANHE